ncbi:glycoside hydrolase family 47 protein [Tothia fuscella]|uniref:alpha-1,2-Mannosidase n=1 Tax=Tothia fuscella TaxID=1048955 RepID=A0A9P4P3Q5_9PEZI|nr:glycoside hydrolase family 47 protein [Tothia fuscella]
MTFPVALLIVILLLLGTVLQTHQSPRESVPNTALQRINLDRRDEIKSAFNFAWNGYYTAAFPHDELKPLSNGPGESRNGWGATPVDALGTAILMELPDVVNVVLEHVKGIDFNDTGTDISVFESTIRYVGGLLSAYELLRGPFSHLNMDEGSVEVLLVKARELAEVLCAAFGEGNALPSGSLNPFTRIGNGENSLAGAGTLVLEWIKLSALTKDSKYANFTQKAEDFLLNPKPKSTEAFPGMVPIDLNITTGQFKPSDITWGGSSDSFYEYLLKMYIYDPKSFPQYKDRWIQAADSSIQYLASSPRGYPDLVFLGRYDEKAGMFVPQSGHMECFAGGNYILGGMVLGEQKYTDFGLKLVHSCHHTYISTTTHIGPETFSWIPSQCSLLPPPTSPPWLCNQPYSPTTLTSTNATGFYIIDPSYNLRPEVLESYYYAYRFTRDEKYRDWAWDAWVAINGTARVGNGYSYVRDVDKVDGGGWGDNMESYFFSETLKYLWLIFGGGSREGEGEEWQVSVGDGAVEKWVYNTEGHPLKVRK